jgi:hypothetical protein
MDRIRILAQRDDLAFLELTCAACRSQSLGIILADGSDARRDGLVYGEFQAADRERFRDALPIDAADLSVARELLRRRGIDAFVGRTGGGPDRGPA